MESNFSADFFTANRERLRQLFAGKAPIVLTANGQLQRNYDNVFPFRQDSNFWYLTGLEHQDLILVMDKEGEFLIIPERDNVVEMFDGKLISEKLTERSGIKQIYDQKTGWQMLKKRVKKVKHVASLAAAPAYIERHEFYTNPARARLIEQLKEINPDLNILDLREQFIKMRIIKQPAELAAIQQAVDITVGTLNKLSKQLHKFEYEYELEAALTYEFNKRGARRHAFSPVIAAGVNTAQVHYMGANSHIKDGPVLLDVGAEIENYAADITRTYPLKPFTKRQREVYEAVNEIQKYAMSLIKPGVAYDKYEQQVEHFVGEKLRELHLIKTIDSDNVRKYFPHLTSHFMGLDVHDIGNRDQVFEAGMVLTVEPGIYISKEGIGVRIEDDLLITESGIEVLTAKLQ